MFHISVYAQWFNNFPYINFAQVRRNICVCQNIVFAQVGQLLIVVLTYVFRSLSFVNFVCLNCIP